MKSADLHKIWGAPDNSRLTAKQQSFRLPTHVAARIDALCDLFPNKTKTEIVGDLLAAAIDELVPTLPSQRGEVIDEHPEHGKMYSLSGAAVDFQKFANKHYKEIERELGNKQPGDLYTAQLVAFERDPE